MDSLHEVCMKQMLLSTVEAFKYLLVDLLYVAIPKYLGSNQATPLHGSLGENDLEATGVRIF